MAMETSTKDSGKKGKDTEKAFTSIKKMADSKSLFFARRYRFLGQGPILFIKAVTID